ncbi:hypothetical protein [Nannocystis pusilla]|uniref:hypothetical protein n=1 Tax=Nannocystis pusilla TaxID=889268 RepID=UPI003B815886
MFTTASLDAQGAGASVRTAASAVGASIAALMKQHPTTRLVVCGFDQGAIALRLAEVGMADVAVALGAMLPTELHPVRPTQASVIMIHGTSDPWPAMATMNSFSKAGFVTTWRPVQGAEHRLHDLLATAQDELVASFAKLPEVETLGFQWTADCKLDVYDAGASMRYLLPRILDDAQGATLTGSSSARKPSASSPSTTRCASSRSSFCHRARRPR